MKHGEGTIVFSTRRFGFLDFIIIAILALAAVAFIPAMHASSPATVVVSIDGHILARYPLSENKSFAIEGREGPLTISIFDKGVMVAHSFCKNQVCVRSGRITKPFQQIICAPNHVIVEITSSQAADSIDAILQ